MNLKELFDSFKVSAFRLERLPEYRVPQDVEAVAQFMAEGTIPDGFNSGWAEIVSRATSSGRTMQRLRLLSNPLSPYEEFEIAAYEAGVQAGEDIRVGLSRDHPAAQDFWLFDGKWLARMNYGQDGTFNGAEVVEASPTELEQARMWIDVFGLSERLRDRYPRAKSD